MDQNNKQGTYGKNPQTEKAPQQGLKSSNQNAQSQNMEKEDASKASTNPTPAQKPSSEQVKHS